jgi:outer membrane protein OmpA-like peptidoglycan-associated protein
MKQSLVAVALFALAASGTTACASKGFVRTQVGQVSSKVDSLSQALEATQERTKQNEARIAEVDTKTAAAQALADKANSAAGQADAKAVAADASAKDARDVGMKADEHAANVEKSTKRVVYEVVLSEDQGNFKFGSTKLPDEAKAKIDEMINQIKANPNGAYFEIEGHTDNVGAEMTNEKIGQDRADAVKRYLYEQHQIPLFRMNVISYGEAKPVGDNKTKDGRAQNRRVVIRVLA